MNNKTKIAVLTARMAVLESRGGAQNWNIIAKIKRRIRKLMAMDEG